MIREYHGLYTAETALSHLADERMETTSVCRSNNGLLPDGKIIKMYNISSNAYRQAIRYNGALRLLEMVDLTIEEIPEIAAVVLFSGGPRLESSENVTPVKFLRTCCELFPLIDLLGCTVIFTMIEGRLSATQLNALTPEMLNFKPEKGVIDRFKINPKSLPQKVVEFQFNTKRDPRKHFNDKKSGERLDMPDEIDQAYMKKNTECGVVANMFECQIIIKGTRLGHCVHLTSHSPKHLGMLGSCWASCLKKWDEEGGKIGGKISQGNGQVSWQYLPNLPSPEIYENFVTERKDLLKKIILEGGTWKDKNIITKLVV